MPCLPRRLLRATQTLLQPCLLPRLRSPHALQARHMSVVSAGPNSARRSRQSLAFRSLSRSPSLHRRQLVAQLHRVERCVDCSMLLAIALTYTLGNGACSDEGNHTTRFSHDDRRYRPFRPLFPLTTRWWFQARERHRRHWYFRGHFVLRLRCSGLPSAFCCVGRDSVLCRCRLRLRWPPIRAGDIVKQVLATTSPINATACTTG